MKSIKKFAMVAALAIAGLMAGNTAFAQTNCSCVLDSNGCKVVTFYDEFDNPISTETICGTDGVGTFECSRELPPQGPISTNPIPRDLVARAFSPTYGVVETHIDRERRSSPAIVRSLGKERFPLYVRFSFYVRSIVGGVEYCSSEELVFESNNVNSFQPFNNERFCLVNDVKLFRCDGSAGSIVLHAGQTCVFLR
jgi:hypothetical protein